MTKLLDKTWINFYTSLFNIYGLKLQKCSKTVVSNTVENRIVTTLPSRNFNKASSIKKPLKKILISHQVDVFSLHLNRQRNKQTNCFNSDNRYKNFIINNLMLLLIIFNNNPCFLPHHFTCIFPIIFFPIFIFPCKENFGVCCKNLFLIITLKQITT